MQKALCLAVVGLFLAPAAALADPQFSAEDIVNHFSGAGAAAAAQRPSGTGGDKPLILPLTGAKREVALGAARSDGFDLLITFEFGSDRLTAQAQQNLDTFARALSSPALAAYGFEVQGHTDAVGPEAKNQALSERRARSVVAYLVRRGIDGSRLRAKGYGESRPLMTDPKHPKNRRVETRRIR